MFTKRLWALLLVVGLAIPACADLSHPTEPGTTPAPQWLLGDVTGALNAVLLQCDPLPPAKVSQKVGVRGGTIKIGPHTLVIPKDALAGTTVITAEIFAGEAVNSVRFTPEGLQFVSPAKLTMSYANCNPLITAPKKIVYTTEALSILEVLTSTDSKKAKTVSAPLTHFSRYAVAW